MDFTWRRSLLYFSGFFLSGFSILMISYWQSTQCTGRALAVSLSRSLLWPPVLTLLLPLLLGREALWVCHSLAEVLTAGTALLLLRRGHRSGHAPPDAFSASWGARISPSSYIPTR